MSTGRRRSSVHVLCTFNGRVCCCLVRVNCSLPRHLHANLVQAVVQWTGAASPPLLTILHLATANNERAIEHHGCQQRSFDSIRFDSIVTILEVGGSSEHTRHTD